jgi:hypothetical protein
MCYPIAGKPVLQLNTICECECGCPVLLSIDEEIRKLEEHRKILQDRIEIIDKKIAGLKTVKG